MAFHAGVGAGPQLPGQCADSRRGAAVGHSERSAAGHPVCPEQSLAAGAAAADIAKSRPGPSPKGQPMNGSRNIAGLAVLLVAASLTTATLQAQSNAPAANSPQGDTWASIAKLPDWQGI